MKPLKQLAAYGAVALQALSPLATPVVGGAALIGAAALTGCGGGGGGDTSPTQPVQPPAGITSQNVLQLYNAFVQNGGASSPQTSVPSVVLAINTLAKQNKYTDLNITGTVGYDGDSRVDRNCQVIYNKNTGEIIVRTTPTGDANGDLDAISVNFTVDPVDIKTVNYTYNGPIGTPSALAQSWLKEITSNPIQQTNVRLKKAKVSKLNLPTAKRVAARPGSLRLG